MAKYDLLPIGNNTPKRKPTLEEFAQRYKLDLTPVDNSNNLFRRVVGDTAISLGKGIVGTGEAVVGLADIATGGHTGKALENSTGYNPKRTKEFLEQFYSQDQQRANQKVQEADGFIDTLKTSIENPSTILQTVVESAPSMLGGGAAAQGLGKLGLLARSPVARGAIGEGLVAGGQSAEQIRQENPDGLLTPKQSLAAGLSGVTTGTIGFGGGKLAQKLGILDPQTVLAGSSKLPKGLDKHTFGNVLKGFLSEGALQELPQSATEQMWQNYAQDKPLLEGVPEASATGLLAGGVMGAGANFLHSRSKQPAQQQPTSTKELLRLGYDDSHKLGYEGLPTAPDVIYQGTDYQAPPQLPYENPLRLGYDGLQPAPDIIYQGTDRPRLELPSPTQLEPNTPDFNPNLTNTFDPVTEGLHQQANNYGLPEPKPTGTVSKALLAGATTQATTTNLQAIIPTPTTLAPAQQLNPLADKSPFEVGRITNDPFATFPHSINSVLPENQVAIGRRIKFKNRPDPAKTPNPRPRKQEVKPTVQPSPEPSNATVSQQTVEEVASKYRLSTPAELAHRSGGTLEQAKKAIQKLSLNIPQEALDNPADHPEYFIRRFDLPEELDPFKSRDKASQNLTPALQKAREAKKAKVLNQKIRYKNTVMTKQAMLDQLAKEGFQAVQRYQRKQGREYSFKERLEIRKQGNDNPPTHEQIIKPYYMGEKDGESYYDLNRTEFDYLRQLVNKPSETNQVTTEQGDNSQQATDQQPPTTNIEQKQEPASTPIANQLTQDINQLNSQSYSFIKNYQNSNEDYSYLIDKPITQVFPEPDYQQLIAQGTNLHNLAIFRAIRDSLPNIKPSYFRKNEMAKVLFVKAKLASEVLNADKNVELTIDFDNESKNQLYIKAKLYEALGHNHSLRKLGATLYQESADQAPRIDLKLVNGKTLSPIAYGYLGTFESEQQAIDFLKDYIAKHPKAFNQTLTKKSPKPIEKPQDTANQETAQATNTLDNIIQNHKGKMSIVTLAKKAKVQYEVAAEALAKYPEKQLEPVTDPVKLRQIVKENVNKLDEIAVLEMTNATPEQVKEAFSAISHEQLLDSNRVYKSKELAKNALSLVVDKHLFKILPANDGLAQKVHPDGYYRVVKKTQEEIAQEQQPKQPQPSNEAPSKEDTTTTTQETKRKAKIQDFGEKIEGAKKDFAQQFKDAISKDVRGIPLSESFPEPDYNRLIADGVPQERVAMFRAMRDTVPSQKPRSRYDLDRWAHIVERIRHLAEMALTDDKYNEVLKGIETMPSLNNVGLRAKFYQALGHDHSLRGISFERYAAKVKGKFMPRAIFLKEISEKTLRPLYYRDLAYFETEQETIDFLKEHLNKQPEAKAKDKKTEFAVYINNYTKDRMIGKKVGRKVIIVKEGFENYKQAKEYIANNQQELEATLDKLKTIESERKLTNAPRIGKDWRKGKDVTPEQFNDTFGFRGVQFGNYVEGAKRQADLNQTYDALLDLAEILELPPKALSLNGELGLAFGARGKGGKQAALAHYEPVQVVINLTKKEGAGTLAHEWFHALDNYFLRTEQGNTTSYLSQTNNPTTNQLRQEVIDGFKNLIKAINQTELYQRSKSKDRKRFKDYWSTNVEMSARVFEDYIGHTLADRGDSNDFLVNLKELAHYQITDEYPYLFEKEQPVVFKAIKELFKAIKTRETAKGNIALYSRSSQRGNRLYAIHNLTTENLEFAEHIGGLAVPSIAISREGLDADLKYYGEITLIGNQSLIDPTSTPVYSGDAFTPRFPEPTYSRVYGADARALYNELAEEADRLNDGVIPQLDQAINYKNYRDSFDILTRSEAAKSLFLKEHGINIALKYKKPTWRYGLSSQQVKSIAKEVINIKSKGYSDQAISKLKDKVISFVRENNHNGVETLVEYIENADLSGFYRLILEDTEKFSRLVKGKQLDFDETNYQISSAINKRELQLPFRKWVREKLAKVFKDPKIEINGRKLPYTLDNIVRKMTGSRIQSAEKTLTFGTAKAKAESLERIKSMSRMRELANRQIRGREEVEQQIDKASNKQIYYRSQIMNYYRDQWNKSMYLLLQRAILGWHMH